MFRIGDFSRLSRVTVKTLRYYDEIGLLRPAHVDQFTNYRYYSAEQLPRLNRILALKDLGFSLDEIAHLLDENVSAEEMRGMLHMRQMQIQRDIADDQAKLALVEMRLRQLEQEDKMSRYEVMIKQVETVKVASVRDVRPTYSDIGSLFAEVIGYLMQNRVAPGKPFVGIYHDPEYREEHVDLEAAVPVDRDLPGTKLVKIHELPGDQMAYTIHKGHYQSIGEAYNALMQWIESNNYKITGPGREVYLQGPEPGIDPSSFVTEIQFPVEKA